MLRAARVNTARNAPAARPLTRFIARHYAKGDGSGSPPAGKAAEKPAKGAQGSKAPAAAPAAAKPSSPAAASGASAAEMKKAAAPAEREAKAKPADKGAEKKEAPAAAKAAAAPAKKDKDAGAAPSKSGGKGDDKRASKSAAKEEEEGGDIDDAKAKREKRAAKKAAMKEEEAEAAEKAADEVPMDEMEEEGEFVPPTAAPMSPLEAEEVLRRANSNAERGSNLLKVEKYEEAEALIQAAFYQYKGLLPEHHPRMLKTTMELAFVYQVHGRKDAALALYDRGSQHWAQMLGAESREYGSLLANWAELLATVGKHADAEAKVTEALKVLGANFAPEHELIGGLIANLAAYQAAQSKWDDAYASSTKALKILEKALGAGHDYTIFCLENLLKLLNDQGKTDTVEELKLIWQQKTKRPFRVLTQADVDKLMPTDDDMAKLPEQPIAPSTPRSKSFTPPGKMVTPEAFAAEMTAFWKKVQAKGLDTNPAMQNVVLDDLVRARVISPQEREALLQRKREQLSQMILEKISSFTPEQTKLMVKQYIQVQEAAEEVSQWDNQGVPLDAFEVDGSDAAAQKPDTK